MKLVLIIFISIFLKQTHLYAQIGAQRVFAVNEQYLWNMYLGEFREEDADTTESGERIEYESSPTTVWRYNLLTLKPDSSEQIRTDWSHYIRPYGISYADEKNIFIIGYFLSDEVHGGDIVGLNYNRKTFFELNDDPPNFAVLKERALSSKDILREIQLGENAGRINMPYNLRYRYDPIIHRDWIVIPQDTSLVIFDVSGEAVRELFRFFVADWDVFYTYAYTESGNHIISFHDYRTHGESLYNPISKKLFQYSKVFNFNNRVYYVDKGVLYQYVDDKKSKKIKNISTEQVKRIVYIRKDGAVIVSKPVPPNMSSYEEYNYHLRNLELGIGSLELLRD